MELLAWIPTHKTITSSIPILRYLKQQMDENRGSVGIIIYLTGTGYVYVRAGRQRDPACSSEEENPAVWQTAASWTINRAEMKIMLEIPVVPKSISRGRVLAGCVDMHGEMGGHCRRQRLRKAIHHLESISSGGSGNLGR